MNCVHCILFFWIYVLYMDEPHRTELIVRMTRYGIAITRSSKLKICARHLVARWAVRRALAEGQIH